MPQVGLDRRRGVRLAPAFRQAPDFERPQALGDPLPALRDVARQLGFLHRARIAQTLEVRKGVERRHREREQRKEDGVDDLAAGALVHLVDEVLHAGFEW